MPYIDSEEQKDKNTTRRHNVIAWIFLALALCPFVAMVVYFAIEYFQGR